MSAPLSVPSKVAVTAIRGLIVGTTCSLALLTEDRRRRISNAQNVIQNADRIRAAKSYRAGGAEVALARDEDAVLFDPVKVGQTEVHLQGVWGTRADITEDGWSADSDFPDAPAHSRRSRNVQHSRHDSTRVSEQWFTEQMTNNMQETIGTTPNTRTGERVTERWLMEEMAKATPMTTSNKPDARTTERVQEQLLRDERARREQDTRTREGTVFARARRKRPTPMIRPHAIADPRMDLAQTKSRGQETAPAPSTMTSLALPDMENIPALVEKCVATRDPSQIDHGITVLLHAVESRVGRGELDESMVAAAALLARTCQDVGRFHAAADILHKVLQCNQLREELYHDFRPLDLLADGLLSEFDENSVDGRVDYKRLAIVADLYLAKFQESPQIRTEQGFDIGKRLLDISFAANWMVKIEALYWRCLVHRQDDFEFTQWYISQLHQKQDYKLAIKVFLLTYPKMSPSQASIVETGETVVASVVAAKSIKAKNVLPTLRQLCANTCLMPGAWVTKLLEVDYGRRQDFDGTMELFNSVRDGGLQHAVTSPRDVYRTMIRLAHEAGRPEVAETLAKETGTALPRTRDNTRISSARAVAKARSGDWVGVEQEFMSMKDQQHQGQGDMGQIFRPILKIYARNHTIAETDEFLRHYIGHVQVPICRQVATFMAQEYGSVRDTESLVAWLEYCAECGLAFDAAFTNSIISTLRTHWKMPYRNLQTLYQTIRNIGGQLANKNTTRIMIDAALTQSKTGREPSWFLIKRLDTSAPRALKAQCLAGKCYSEQDVLLAMKERLSRRFLPQALAIYWRARSKHLNLPTEAHRLAIRTILEVDGRNFDAAYRVLDHAQENGHGINSLVMPIISAQVAQIDPNHEKEQKYLAIREILQGLVERQIRITDSILNQAAYGCLQAGHFPGAINFAIMAAEAYRNPRGPARPSDVCYNTYNFSILIQAFAAVEDLDMLRSAIAKARASPYWTDALCMKAMKQAKKILRNKHDTTDVEEARSLIAEAYDDILAKRADLRHERADLQDDMLDIMRKAALEAQGREEGGGSADVERPATPHEHAHADGSRTLHGYEEFEERLAEAATR